MSKVKITGHASGSGTLTLTGPNTNSDRTITLPDATGTVLTQSGSSAITTTGVITGGTVEATTDTAAGDNAAIGYTSAEGLILTGQGSTSDITLKNDADGTVFTVPTGTDDILFPDNAKALWGAGSDLQIYHDGSNSYIQDDGTGDLIIKGANDVRIKGDNDESLATFGQNAACYLYYDNTLTFNTSNTGVSATGNPGDSTSEGVIEVNSSTSGTGTGILFFKGDGTAIGRISVQGGSNATSYVTSSDYRMKQDIADMDTVWDTIKGLQPRKFKWKSNVAGGFDIGFIAHEAAAQIPSSVSGTKDATQNVTNAVLTASGDLHKQGITEAKWTEGKSEGIYASDSTWTASATVNDYQGIDTNKMIPYLVKGLKEAIARIETLETKVTALEG